ncbi:SPOR domain-containing protein [Natronogracilivirga saccharolytica]|uniref:SPOR domain-containing protein n=1 Tax=Natronogracilivirga saccharolytica TaxID=2812953 RepID=A0A8J7UTZ0_9BACT|nr:SPOR domain-containing protein [Natronogracilivirga saccharolytica]MBP3193071.1 SPOR domain-containing protein [Natronogracilivirga saccharolytica]
MSYTPARRDPIRSLDTNPAKQNPERSRTTGDHAFWNHSGFFRTFLISAALIAASCAPSEELRDDEMELLLDEAIEDYADLAEELDKRARTEPEPDDYTVTEVEEHAVELLEELPELAFDLKSHRSQLSDQGAVFLNEIPDIYLSEPETEERREPDRGYRIQIVSTEDARLANDIKDHFDDWIREVSAPPYPNTYMTFRPPYYRVHVGDYLSREKAMEFTEFVRLEFDEAWVVHSSINPARVER